MTVTMAGDPVRNGEIRPQRTVPAPTGPAPARRPGLGVRAGQIVAAQAAAALLIAASGHGPLALIGAAVVAVGLSVSPGCGYAAAGSSSGSASGRGT